MKLFVCTLLVSLPLCTALPALTLEQLTRLVLKLQLEILRNSGLSASAPGAGVPASTGTSVGASGTAPGAGVPASTGTSVGASGTGPIGGAPSATSVLLGAGGGAGNVGAIPSGVVATVGGTVPNTQGSSGISPSLPTAVIPVAASTTPVATVEPTTLRPIEETTQNPVEMASLALLKIIPATTTDLLTDLTKNGVEITDSIKNQTDALLAEAEMYGKKASETFDKAQASESAEKERLMVQYYKYAGKQEKFEAAASTLVEMGIHISEFYAELQVTTKELAGLLTLPDVLPPEPLPAV